MKINISKQALQETWSGISQVTMMQKLAQSDDFASVIPHLKAIAKHVLDASLMRCSIVAEEQSLPKAEQKLGDLLNGISNSQSIGLPEFRVSPLEIKA